MKFNKDYNFFYNKRAEDGTLLKFEGHRLSLRQTNKFFELFTNSSTYKVLTTKFPKEYIDGYFKKLFFYQILPVTNQIVIHNWHEKNTKKSRKNNIFLSSFFLERPFLFKKVLPIIFENYKKYNFIQDSFFKIIKRKSFVFLKEIYFHILSFPKIFIKTNFPKNDKTSIGVSYSEGISENKRSDLFWYYDSKIKNNNIFLFIDYRHLLKKYNEIDKLKKLQENLNFKVIKVWENKNFKRNSLFNSIKKDLNKLKNNNSLDEILVNISLDFLKKIEFWYYIFKKYNVKIYFEHREWSDETIAKQIALDLLNGCSVGKLRSYISSKPEKHYLFYPNDIFCCWGKKNVENYDKKVLLKSEFKPKAILTTGYPYGYTTLKTKTEVQKIKQKFEKKKTKFNLLLIDNAFGKNDNFTEQLIPYDIYKKLYELFFNWLIKDSDIGLIVKPKRKDFLKDFKNLKINFKDAVNTGRCHLVEDTFQKIPWHYSELVDFAISVSVDTMPSSLIDCMVNNSKLRSVFFDFSQELNQDEDFYKWAKNKVIFNDIEKMKTAIQNYKSDPSRYNDIGLWDKNYINSFDPFRDKKGHSRIGEYINSLLEGYDQGLKKNEVIKIANANFASKWGNNNIKTYQI